MSMVHHEPLFHPFMKLLMSAAKSILSQLTILFFTVNVKVLASTSPNAAKLMDTNKHSWRSHLATIVV